MNERGNRSVQDVMTSPVITVGEGVTVREAAKTMLDNGIGAVIVTNSQGDATGLLSESDIAGIRKAIPFSLALAPMLVGAKVPSDAELRHLFDEGSKLTARDVMSSSLVAVQKTAGLNEVLHLMLDRNIKHIPVLDGRKPVGMIARHDLLRLFATEAL